MNSRAFDVVIVGSGPAGTSAAYPLVEAGLDVLMVDGGKTALNFPPENKYLDERQFSQRQWEWIIGKDFHALRHKNAVSPKLRSPTHDYVFSGFNEFNQIRYEKFIGVGSLARGGLSNAWGCGVARLSHEDLDKYPVDRNKMFDSYQIVARRIGISGAVADDLSEYFGVDDWSQPPVEMDSLNRSLYAKYQIRNRQLNRKGFRLGRARVAVLSEPKAGRSACDLSNNCLWGCDNKSLYSAEYEIDTLQRAKNFTFESGCLVQSVDREGDAVMLNATRENEKVKIRAKKVILAAGTLATTGIVLRALDRELSVNVKSCPNGAFILWLPQMLGKPRENGFGLGQLAFSMTLDRGENVFGSTFSTLGIPVTEFSRYLPLTRRNGIGLLSNLLGSCLVANLFLSGELSSSSASIDKDGFLAIKGGHKKEVDELMAEAKRRLADCFRKLGAVMLPKSFTQGEAGGDIHYSGTLPMKNSPMLGETSSIGEVEGLPDVYVVDGACLPELTEKSHTLTIMANADRISREIVRRFVLN